MPSSDAKLEFQYIPVNNYFPKISKTKTLSSSQPDNVFQTLYRDGHTSYTAYTQCISLLAENKKSLRQIFTLRSSANV